MPQQTTRINLDTPDQTCRLAQELGQRLAPGDTILLGGDIGAGKTHFARCLIQNLLDAPEDIPSPTYTLVQTYESAAGEIWHADLYRLTDLSEIDELGLSLAFTDAICLVEWPDRLGDQAPASALTLLLDTPHGDDRRVATFSWTAPSWNNKLQIVPND